MKKRMKRPICMTALSLAMAALLLTGCGEKAEAEETEADILEVHVVSPSMNDVEVDTEFVGTLEYEDTISVYPKLSGEVKETYFEEGQHVNAGDLLFTLDDEALQMSLENAEAAYDSAKAGTDSQLGAIQMQRDSAANSLATAQEGIAQTQNSYDYMQEQYSDLESSKSDLEDDKEDMEDDKSDAKKKLKKAKSGLSDAKEYYAELQEQYNEAVAAGDEDLAASLKDQMEDAMDAVESAQAAVTTLQTSISSMTTAIKTYDSNIDTLESSQDNLDYQMKNLGYTYNQAVRGTGLAQESLDYYDNYTAPATKETADATMRQAEVGVDTVKLQLEYTQVTAPVSGTIKTKSIDKYDMAQAGVPAYVIVSDAGMLASFKVPENVRNQLTEGQEVSVERNGQEYTASITEVPDEVDAASGLFIIKALVSGDPGQLVSGTSVEITAVTDKAQNVLTVPVDAVYYEGGRGFVYAAENNVVKKVYVETGIFDNEKIQILDGVDPDMKVITTWSSDMRDGLEITVSDAQ